jgi:Integral membrane protein, interacts with FtsH
LDQHNQDFDKFNGQGEGLAIKTSITNHMIKVYGWMFIGMLMTAGMSYYTSVSSLKYIALNRFGFLVLVIIELGLVWFLSSRALTMKYENAAAAFIVYSGINGLTLSVIFLSYDPTSITVAFVVTAAFFGTMSVYGLVTKQDLTRWGPLLFAGLIGIIIATIINMFMRSDTLMYVISYIGVAIFLGLTAYDTKKIKEIHARYAGSEKERNIAIIGALTLYLDFINLFLFILRILGRRR